MLRNAWEEPDGYHDGTLGINNMNTMPFDNIPYANINSIGKQWIRKYALALVQRDAGTNYEVNLQQCQFLAKALL
jgi:hypothetical protein